MQIVLRLNAANGLTLPIDYNHIVQSAIYHSIAPALATFLHEQGFTANGRVFRLFCFSRLLGPFTMDRNSGKITFGNDVRLVISSPVVDFVQSLANGLLQQGGWRLGSTFADITEIGAEQPVVESENINIRTLSPVTAYSTMSRPDGRKYTVYFQPGDPDYNALITANLQKKYQAFFREEPPEGEVKVKAAGQIKMNLLQYKGTVIKGYSGPLQLTGPQELLQMAVDCGLGSKNSQGFGCLALSN
ncbi:CRISPR-associated endoribonuclease Cas6 [Methylomusa anaerophila]|uniref:CRISPR-associated endoribonuclease n=1 Tax=Methylomusa anaerophila TaxID=1930071 RepID=A0A348AR39_9FIRM|nr:CRISPR-associated endoribonuclease Cas6 [Methylomusa anaerophila]BBB93537.1 CRISPR associated protein Cas6 [Methylomusa anaerophila]